MARKRPVKAAANSVNNTADWIRYLVQKIDKYGVRLDSFVVDDGYENRESIWKTDLSIVPGDFGKLADYLRAHGSRFGIWMPLTTPAPYLDVEWGKQQDDGEVLLPQDNADGQLQPGLIDLLTVHGGGTPNINTSPGPVLRIPQ